MNVVVNGKPRDVDEGATIADLVAVLGLHSRNVVVERNGEPVARERFAAEVLAGEDVLEIVRAVPGG